MIFDIVIYTVAVVTVSLGMGMVLGARMMLAGAMRWIILLVGRGALRVHPKLPDPLDYGGKFVSGWWEVAKRRCYFWPDRHTIELWTVLSERGEEEGRTDHAVRESQLFLQWEAERRERICRLDRALMDDVRGEGSRS